MINKIHDNLYTAESCLYKIYTTAHILIALYMKNFEEYTVPVAPIKVKNTIICRANAAITNKALKIVLNIKFSDFLTCLLIFLDSLSITIISPYLYII